MKRPILTEEFSKKQLLKNIIKEEVRKALLELSPELLSRAAQAADKDPNRKVQASKFAMAAAKKVYDAQQLIKTEKTKLVQPFVGKTITIYYDVANEFGTARGFSEAVPIPYEISQIMLDTDGVYFLSLAAKKPYERVKTYVNMFYNPDLDTYLVSKELIGDGNWYSLRGFDIAGAQIFTKLAKTIKPDSNITPNSLIKGETTPLAGKAFRPASPI